MQSSTPDLFSEVLNNDTANLTAIDPVARTPSYIQQNARPYLYNFDPSQFPNWRKALANVRTGAADAILTCYGDSTTAGVGSNGTSYGLATAAYPARLAKYLSNSGVTAGNDSRLGSANSNQPSTYDPRLTIGSGWNLDYGASGYSYGGPAFQNNTTTNNLSFAPTNSIDTVDVYYFDTSGSFTINFDGGTNTTVTGGATNALKKTTITTTAGVHTINVARVSGNVEVSGFVGRTSTVKQVQVHNAGVGSATSANLSATNAQTTSLNALKAVAPNLTILNVGINDMNTALPVATFSPNMQTIITGAKVSGDVLLVFPTSINPANASAATVAQFKSALQALAVTNNVPMLDLNGRLSYANAVSAGMQYDNLHPNGLLYDDEGALLASIIGAI